MDIRLIKLNKTIIKCKKCPRLVNFIKKISTEKRKQNKNENYWGKPVAGFGDTNAKLLILGLAPAAHGGTRTGRAFTGDKSGEFLFKCLHKAKYAFNKFQTFENLNSFYQFKFAKNKDKQIKDLKNFIKKWNDNKNLILVTHYVVIQEIFNTDVNSGEIIVSDKNYEIIGRIQTNY